MSNNKNELENINRFLLKLEFWLVIPVLLLGLVLIFVAALITMPQWLKIVLIVFAILIIIAVCLVAVKIEQKAGYYECQVCHHRYVPTYRQVLLAMHAGRTRRMVCPKCGEKSWQKKVLSEE